jgi:CheY-like chemotaxis protein
MDDQYELKATIRRNLQGAKILLVEDNPDHCTLIQTALEKCMPEIKLLIAATNEEAMILLNTCVETRQRLPRLILLDLYLPKREDGWKLIRLLKESASPFRLIPITLLSYSEEPNDIRICYDLGVASYIVKPTTFQQWLDYFQALRHYWWHTVTLPLR